MHRYGVPEERAAVRTLDPGTLHGLQDDPVLRVVLDEVRAELLPVVRNGLVAVADAHGQVLLTAGPDEARVRAERVGLATGVVWTCLTGGLNGIGRTVRDRRGNQCFAETHWRVEQFELVCDVAPVIYGNELIAAINITNVWVEANTHTLPMLRFFAERVADRLGQADRDGRLRRRAARQLLDRYGAPALVIRDNSVIEARDLPVCPGDPIDFPDTPVAGLTWHQQLGFVTLEPLSSVGCWLVRAVSGTDRSTMRVVLDFTDRRQPVVRLRGTVVELDHPVSRPQQVDVLTALARNRAGLDAKELSRLLYGHTGGSRNIPPLLSRLRDELWWLLPARGYRLAEQLDIELRCP